MKELLEEYVVEAQQLRSQSEFLARLVSVLWNDVLEYGDSAADEVEPITVTDLERVTLLDIRIEEGVVSVG